MAEVDNVIITRRFQPPPQQPIVRDKPVVYERKMEFLSQQAVDYLKKAGYSRHFIDMVGLFLNDAANANRATNDVHMNGRPKPSYDMPKKLAGFTDADGERKEIMPFIFTYAPTTKFDKNIFDAFASREGQRFMHKEYHWLQVNERSGEWDIVPPPPSAVVPKRTR